MPPISRGLAKFSEISSERPSGRNASAMRATSGKQLGRDHADVGVDVVDRAAVDADRGHQAGVVAHAVEILGDVTVFPEDRLAGVAALDRAVEIVPMVEEADGGVGLFVEVEVGNWLVSGDAAEEGEGAVEDAAAARGGDDEAGVAAFVE